jgi:hypothetical protein
MRGRWSSSGATLVIGILAAHSAQAQSATAEALFQEGKALMKSKQYEQACPKLEESYRQDPATGALLALAMCHEKQGKLAAAWAEFIDVASRSKQEGRKDRADSARKSAEALYPRLSQLTLKVDSESATIQGLEVRRDGEVVGQGAWGTAVPVDPGQHKIEVSAPGRESWSTVVAVGPEGDRRTVDIPTLKAAARVQDSQANAASTNAGGKSQPPSDTPSSNPKDMSTLQIVGLVTAGVGVVGLGLGTYFGISAIKGKSDTDPACPNENCIDQASYDKRHDAVASGNLATIAFIAGGVLAATGTTLFIVGKPRSAEAGPSAQLVPLVGPRDTGVALVGNF